MEIALRIKRIKSVAADSNPISLLYVRDPFTTSSKATLCLIQINRTEFFKNYLVDNYSKYTNNKYFCALRTLWNNSIHYQHKLFTFKQLINKINKMKDLTVANNLIENSNNNNNLILNKKYCNGVNNER